MKELKRDENGNFIADSRYKAILKLDKLLKTAGIPHVLDRCWEGWRVAYPGSPERGDCKVDFVEHDCSYGADKDLLEMLDHDTDFVKGYISAEQAFEIIAKIEEREKQ